MDEVTNLCDLAFMAKLLNRPEDEDSKEHLEKACNLAVEQAENEYEEMEFQAFYYRQAAEIALELGQMDRARDLVNRALSLPGDLPADIAEELHRLLKRIDNPLSPWVCSCGGEVHPGDYEHAQCINCGAFNPLYTPVCVSRPVDGIGANVCYRELLLDGPQEEGGEPMRFPSANHAREYLFWEWGFGEDDLFGLSYHTAAELSRLRVNKPVDVTGMHDKAMELCDLALIARQKDGDTKEADRLTNEAYQLERQAAEASTEEPTRSILYRSAATIAFELGKTSEAKELVAAGLAGNPPAEIAQELNYLLLEIEREEGTL